MISEETSITSSGKLEGDVRQQNDRCQLFIYFCYRSAETMQDEMHTALYHLYQAFQEVFHREFIYSGKYARDGRVYLSFLFPHAQLAEEAMRIAEDLDKAFTFAIADSSVKYI